MKNTVFSIVLAVCFLFVFQDCKKEPASPNLPNEGIDSLALFKQIKTAEIEKIFSAGPATLGDMSATKNGKNWGATSDIRLYAGDPFFMINAETYNEAGDPREALLLADIPMRIGKYRFFNSKIGDLDDGVKPVYYRLFEDGDLVKIQMFHDQNYADLDFLEVTKLDTLNRVVGGRYDVHLTDSLFFPYPAYLHFANGKFDLKY